MSTYPEPDTYPYPSLRLLTALLELDDDCTESDAPPEMVDRAVAIGVAP